MNDSGNFWAFNNGITAIVNEFDIKDNALSITGISIVLQRKVEGKKQGNLR